MVELDIRRPEQQAALQRLADNPNGLPAEGIATGAVTTAKMAAGAATLPKVTFTGLKTLAAAGKNGAGAITLTGTVVGDRLIAVFGAPTAGGALAVKVPGTDFESVVTVADQIQQIPATDLSTNTYVFILAPATA